MTLKKTYDILYELENAKFNSLKTSRQNRVKNQRDAHLLCLYHQSQSENATGSSQREMLMRSCKMHHYLNVIW
jgi:uracil-DNA glycosylase